MIKINMEVEKWKTALEGLKDDRRKSCRELADVIGKLVLLEEVRHSSDDHKVTHQLTAQEWALAQWALEKGESKG